jgi:hypothetical protein
MVTKHQSAKIEINGNTFIEAIKKAYAYLNSMDFVIERQGKIIIDLPLPLVVLLTIFAFPFVLICLIIALAMKCNLIIR